jgi:multidrug efflux pump subunit AcrA (membrane-fusion protein)
MEFESTLNGGFMKKPVIPVVVVVLALLITTLYFEVFRHLAKNDKIIEGSGTIEITEIEISSKIMARVASISVDEGDEVKKGDILVKLEGEELNAQEKSALQVMKMPWQTTKGQRNCMILVLFLSKNMRQHRQLIR